MGCPVHLPLDRQRHGPLDFLCRMSGPLRDDLDVDVLHIRKRFDRQRNEGTDPHRNEKAHGAKHQQALAKREPNQSADHRGVRSLLRAISFACK